MNRKQPTDEDNPSAKLSCPHCHTQLPLEAVFCSACGKRVKKIGDWQIDTEDGNDNTQEADVDTVRLASNPQKHLKRSQSSRSPRNSQAPEQPHLNGPLLQDAAAPQPSLLETGIFEPDLADARAQREAPIAGRLSQPLPTTPVPSIPETWQQVPDTDVPASTPPGLNWLWPIVIILSAVAAALVNFVFTDTAIRPLIVFWFLAVCPGMVLVPFLRLKEPVVEWVLAIALSFAIEALAAGIELYAGKWSPTGTLSILIGLSLGGAIVQLATIHPITPLPVTHLLWSVIVSLRNKVFRPVGVVLKLYLVNPLYKGFSKIVSNRKTTPSLPKLPRTILTRNPRVLVPVLLTLFISIIVGTSLWSYEVYQGSRSATSTSALPHKATPHSSPESTVVPTPTSISPANIAELYNGTIYDIPANVTTSMTLTGIQLTQMTISGNFTGLHKTGTFNGVFDSSKHIQFTVKDSAGHLILSFNGDMQSGGELSGDYCGVDQDARCTGDYGLWSVAPAS